jgi:hypothetical protein
MSITLGYDGIVELGGNVFDYSQMSMISVYVPASLVDAYKSALYWSNYSDHIFPIE